MLLVARDRVGSTAFNRLRRDGVVHDAVGGVALPFDVPATRATRIFMIAPFVPAHTWLTGLAALWCDGLASAPSVLDLAGRRGAHRTVPSPGSPSLAFHSGWLWGLPDAPPPRFATVTRACIDALAHSPAIDALPAVARALGAAATTIQDLARGVGDMDPHTHYRTRVDSLVTALADARGS
jgi:hypothetical protein